MNIPLVFLRVRAVRISFRILFGMLFALPVVTGASALFDADPVLDSQIEGALQHSKQKLQASVQFLQNAAANETNAARRPYFPQYTVNKALTPASSATDGAWVTAHAASSFWAKGSFAAQLWMMADIESEPVAKQQWQDWAVIWSMPLRGYQGGDITVNHYSVFKRWMDQASSEIEREEQRQQILQAARRIIQPYIRSNNTGSFHEDIGIYGYRRQDDATKTWWFHAFIDHTPNVEQMLGASWLTDSEAEALEFRTKAVRHILNMHKTMGSGRNPGSSGSWQRGYFDWNEGSPTYGQFLFNEGKQGWTNGSTWSRGQAWWVYGASLTAYHTRNPEVMQAAREAAHYYCDQLPDNYPGANRQPGIFVPAWDFDYAWTINFDTEYDTSAAAIAVAGLIRLVAALPMDDPDRAKFLSVVRGTLLNLTAVPFLTADDGPEMSILRDGCYHHPASIAPSSSYINGLIWGDYFFVDALLKYRELRDNPPAIPALPMLALDTAAMQIAWELEPGMVYQWETSPDLQTWQDHGSVIEADAAPSLIETIVSFESDQRFWRLRTWPKP